MTPKPPLGVAPTKGVLSSHLALLYCRLGVGVSPYLRGVSDGFPPGVGVSPKTPPILDGVASC